MAITTTTTTSTGSGLCPTCGNYNCTCYFTGGITVGPYTSSTSGNIVIGGGNNSPIATISQNGTAYIDWDKINLPPNLAKPKKLRKEREQMLLLLLQRAYEFFVPEDFVKDISLAELDRIDKENSVDSWALKVRELLIEEGVLDEEGKKEVEAED